MSEPVVRRQQSNDSIGSFILSPSTTPSSDIGSLSDVGSDFELVSEDELDGSDNDDDDDDDGDDDSIGHLALSYPDPQHTPSPPCSPGVEEVSGSSIFRSTATLEPPSPTSEVSMPLTASTQADDDTPTPMAHSLAPEMVVDSVGEGSGTEKDMYRGDKTAGKEEGKSWKAPRQPHLGIVKGGSVLACAAVFAVLTFTGTSLYQSSLAVPTPSIASTPVVVALSTLPTNAIATARPFAKVALGPIACTKSLAHTHCCDTKRKCDLAVVAPIAQSQPVTQAGPSTSKVEKAHEANEIGLTESWDACLADVQSFLRVQANLLATNGLRRAAVASRKSRHVLSLTQEATRKATKQYIRTLPKVKKAVREERKRVLRRAKRGARKLIRRQEKGLVEVRSARGASNPVQCKARRKHHHSRRH